MYAPMSRFLVKGVLVLSLFVLPSVLNAQDATETVFWTSVECESKLQVQAYLEVYPGGAYVDEARACLEGQLGLDRAARVLVQRGLASLDYSAGVADGLFGPATRRAIRAWQAAKGFATTGYLTREQADTLVAQGQDAVATAEQRRREETRRQAEEAAQRQEEEARRKAPVAVAQKRPQPGEVFRDCATCPELVVVPAGTFLMGSPSYEMGRNENEGPVHRVTIDQAFAVGVYEVTVGEYGRFVETTGYEGGSGCHVWTGEKWEEESGRTWRDPGFRQTERDPVVCVSWQDAQAYAEWLSRQTGKAYRLLSEAEWEYVARAGTTTARYWGEREAGQCRYANGAGSRFNRGITCDDGYTRTAPVGSYAANEFGLYDMLGNVLEWVQDCWHESCAGAPSDGRAWESEGCSHRVWRSSAWINRPKGVRSARRLRGTTGHQGSDGGFRIARSLE